MIGSSPRAAAAVVLAAATSIGCSAAARRAEPAPPPPAVVPRPAVTEADVHFMTGMIPHHAQAVRIAGLAPSHGARADVRALAARIVVAQQDEIALVQTWLRDHRLPVPDATAARMHMSMNGMEHAMLMPGMLTDAQLARLDAARGTEFDRLFLEAMIRHHHGAVEMVDQLFHANGAGQDETVFRFASDVYADQTTEIDRMQTMLATLPAAGRGG